MLAHKDILVTRGYLVVSCHLYKLAIARYGVVGLGSAEHEAYSAVAVLRDIGDGLVHKLAAVGVFVV